MKLVPTLFIMKKTIFLIAFLIGFSLIAYSSEDAGGDLPFKGVVHFNSNVSSGSDSPEKIAKTAKDSGCDVVLLTDDLIPKWEYGIFPVRGIVKKKVELNGLLNYGVEKYKERIDKIDQSMTGTTVIMGAEVAPYYYWTGDIIKGLTLNDWEIQLIVAGLDPGDYKDIPTVSNRSFSRYSWKSIFLFWPIVLIVLGVFFLKHKFLRIYIADPLCWIFILAGVVLTLYYYPFLDTKYDQYYGKQCPGAYQEVIDFCNERGGFTFWSAPEATIYVEKGPIIYSGDQAIEYLRATRGYTGFCCFYEGYRQVGGPGGIWDDLLNEYCSGIRKKPVWVIGEMAYHSKGESGKNEIDEVQTVFFAPDNSEKKIFNAMRSGNMYALRQSKGYGLKLNEFTVTDLEGNKAGMGQEILSAGPVTIRIDVSCAIENKKNISIKLIRNGEVIKKFVPGEVSSFEFTDDYYKEGKKIYYRLDIRGNYPNMLFSNPIFVRFVK